jgi:hypothetical protein
MSLKKGVISLFSRQIINIFTPNDSFMYKNSPQEILKHALRLRRLIVSYSVFYLGYWALEYWFPVALEQLIPNVVESYYIVLLGLPITAYAIWYVLYVSPRKEHSKTGAVLGLLFFGIIGLWMTFPVNNLIINRLKSSESRFTASD